MLVINWAQQSEDSPSAKKINTLKRYLLV